MSEEVHLVRRDLKERLANVEAQAIINMKVIEKLELQVSALVGQGLEFQKQIKKLREHLNDPYAHGR